MLVSSTSMNAATASTTAINQGLKLGRQGAAGAEVGALALRVASGSAASRVSGLSAIGSAPRCLRSSLDANYRSIPIRDRIEDAA
jgi:hypothetical protein